MASQALELTSGRGTGSLPLALWASEALRPPNTPQVRSARFFGGEPFVESLAEFWALAEFWGSPRRRRGVADHRQSCPHNYILWLVEGSGYPLKDYF